MVEKDWKSRSPENVYWGFEPTSPIPVRDGVRAHSQRGKFTKSWWAGSWLRALTEWVGQERLSRGRAYARGGQVMEIDVQAGLVLARVQGTRPEPYWVRIEMKPLSEADWERVVDALASQAMYAAQLLNGEMPYDVENVFSSVGVSLFPNSRSDLTTQCSCPDMANPCKHIAAVYYLLGERLDEDPFLLFLLRGHSKEWIMSALRARRARDIPDSLDVAPISVCADKVAAESSLEDCLQTYWEMGPEIEGVQVKVAPAEVEMEIIKILGDLSFAEDENLVERLQDVYRKVSRKALDVAFGEHGE